MEDGDVGEVGSGDEVGGENEEEGGVGTVGGNGS